MKLFKTNNRDTVSYCRMQFSFELPSALAQKRSKDFVAKYRSCDNITFVNTLNLCSDYCHSSTFVFLLFCCLFVYCYHCIMMNKVIEYAADFLIAATVCCGVSYKLINE